MLQIPQVLCFPRFFTRPEKTTRLGILSSKFPLRCILGCFIKRQPVGSWKCCSESHTYFSHACVQFSEITFESKGAARACPTSFDSQYCSKHPSCNWSSLIEYSRARWKAVVETSSLHNKQAWYPKPDGFNAEPMVMCSSEGGAFNPWYSPKIRFNHQMIKESH
ncbi:hypothetical protein L873DRAFT_896589 [Choiromyces venosus 120613-1]|uniref:Uncharacterized protein n=1 Tax=Choiromyces venosus 120613-1 TaxID=1336337 RepID=A0A3N4K126_9PEZI|nr:hypothetical protein L873DRAFT_896589 [Choiromyces venosus 120613-1]